MIKLNLIRSGILAFILSFSAQMPVHADPVTLVLSTGRGSEDVKTPAHWRIVKTKNNLATNEAAAEATAPSFKGDLKPGRYLVIVTLGTITIEKAITIGAGSNHQRLYVDKASFNVQMVAHTDAAKITEPISWELYTYANGGTEKGRKVTTQYGSKADFDVTAGAYVVRAFYKGTKSDLVVQIDPGQRLEYVINLYAGTAKFVTELPNAQNSAVTWQIVRATPDSAGQYQLVNDITDPHPIATIREGDYLVIASLGDLWEVAPLNIRAGNHQEISITPRQQPIPAPKVVSFGGTVAARNP